MRLLVVDQSLILQWLVRHEFPDGLEIASARSFDEAERFLDALPPDAAVVSLPPAELPWREFQRRCASHVPPIPVLYESCVDADAAAVGIDPADGYAAFLHKPASRCDLHEALEALFAASRCNGEADSAAPELSATAPSSARRGS